MTKKTAKEKDPGEAGERVAGTASSCPGQTAGERETDSAPEAGAGSTPGAEAIQRIPPAETPVVDDRLLRVMADFDNFRKRTVREKTEIYRQAQEEVIRPLLSVLDHLDLALNAAATHDVVGAVVDGFRIVSDELLNVLRKFDVTPVDARGQIFDPKKHEAISCLASADAPSEHVILQTRKGYMLGERLLRPAQVIVSSGPPAPDAPPSGGSGQKGID